MILREIASTSGRDGAIFLCHRKLHPMTQKRSAKDRTAAEQKNVAKATRRRRRILQAGFFFTL